MERLTEEEVREAAREQGPIGNHVSLGCRYTRGAYTFTASARVSGLGGGGATALVQSGKFGPSLYPGVVID